MFPFILEERQLWTKTEWCTDDDDKVCVASLHLRGGTRVLVSSEVLGIDNSDDGIELEAAICFALKISDLECEGGRKGGSTGRHDRHIASETKRSREVGASTAHEDSMKIRSGLYLSAIRFQRSYGTWR